MHSTGPRFRLLCALSLAAMGLATGCSKAKLSPETEVVEVERIEAAPPPPSGSAAPQSAVERGVAEAAAAKQAADSAKAAADQTIFEAGAGTAAEPVSPPVGE
ncbi:MAG: hypothetical protein DWH79_03140 [Planctomycetota bacterium]|nr:MAG: hypothetical protein DWH79_03140 [Planctomycetota bacterium]